MNALVMVALDTVRESPLNPRKTFDASKLAELAASIREQGVLQPVLVRPVPHNGKGKSKVRYEVVCGARRFRAATEAGLTEIPAVERELTDEAAFELMIVENLQREDIDPLDEADGFKALTEKGLDLDTVGAKVGKSGRYVFERMRLASLCEDGRKLLSDGQIGVGHAVLIAQLTDDDQKNVVDWFDYESLSVKELRDEIAQRIGRKLSSAPFDTECAVLLPQAGACSGCVKNTGFSKHLFGDVEEMRQTPTCTDKSCWDSKCGASREARVAEAKTANPGAVLLSTFWGGVPDECLSRNYWNEARANAKDTETGIVVHGRDDEIGKVVRFARIPVRPHGQASVTAAPATPTDPEQAKAAESAKRRARLEELRQLRVANVARKRILEACLSSAAVGGSELLSGPLAKAVLAKLVRHVKCDTKGAADVRAPGTGDIRKAVTGEEYNDWRGDKATPERVASLPDTGSVQFDEWLLTLLAVDEIPISDGYRPTGFALLIAAETLGVDHQTILAEVDYELMSKRQRAEHDAAKEAATTTKPESSPTRSGRKSKAATTESKEAE